MREYKTQKEAAGKGILTPEMKIVAEKEHNSDTGNENRGREGAYGAGKTDGSCCKRRSGNSM